MLHVVVNLVATHRHQACQVFLAAAPHVFRIPPSYRQHKNPIFVIKKNKSHAIQLPWGHSQRQSPSLISLEHFP